MPVCHGKIRYRTMLDAKLALVRVQRRRDEQHSPVSEQSIYKCPVCYGWHLTKMEQPR